MFACWRERSKNRESGDAVGKGRFCLSDTLKMKSKWMIHQGRAWPLCGTVLFNRPKVDEWGEEVVVLWVPKSSSAACHLKINIWETSEGREGTFALFKNWHLGRRQSSVPKTIFPVQVNLKGFKWGDAGKGREAPCRRCWCPGGYPYVDMTLNRFAGVTVVRSYLLGKFDPSLLKASSLQVSRKVG